MILNRIAWGEVSKIPHSPDEIHGDDPGTLPLQTYDIEGETDPEKINDSANNYLNQHPDLLTRAKQTGEDIIARVNPHKKGIILTGVGLAGLFGGIVLYRHLKEKKSSKS